MDYVINGIRMFVTCFDMYQYDFERMAKPEYGREAEDYLRNALGKNDVLDGEYVDFVLEAEKTKCGADIIFKFFCRFNIESGQVDCLYMSSF